MRKMIKIPFLLLALVFFVTACGLLQEPEESSAPIETIPLEVETTTADDPEQEDTEEPATQPEPVVTEEPAAYPPPDDSATIDSGAYPPPAEPTLAPPPTEPPPPPTEAPPPAAPGNFRIDMKDFAYDLLNIEVPVGSTVTWFNVGNAEHSATADDVSWDTGLYGTGEEATITFDTPGVFSYYCTLHGAPGGVGMSAIITVVE
jgi:plastocyanin